MAEDFNCPSGSSACSGADARQADKAQSAPLAIGTPIQMLPDGRIVPVEAAVSPRSSDGKVADKALEIYRLFQGVSSRGVGYVLLEDRLVRISIESHKITDESRDG